jgi:hypothetical protein
MEKFNNSILVEFLMLHKRIFRYLLNSTSILINHIKLSIKTTSIGKIYHYG